MSIGKIIFFMALGREGVFFAQMNWALVESFWFDALWNP